MSRKIRKLVFVPTDPLSVYQDIGMNALYDYYNPCHFFDEIVCVSPFEERYTQVQGIDIVTVKGFEEWNKAITSISPDVIRAYGGFYAADIANYYAVKDIPIVTSLHDVASISPSVCRSDLVICMSKAVSESALDIGVDPKRIRILPNRVDLKLFADKSEDTNTKRVRSMFPCGKMILCVARVCRQKNTDNIIKSLKYIPDDYFCVFIAKGDKSLNVYKQIAVDEGVDNRCFWINSIPKNELPYWYSASDCFCLPSRWEGFGVVFIEAAACGLPIVTSNIAPMNEYLNNSSAFMVDEYENPREIAGAVISACNDTKRKTVTENALNVVKRFSKDLVDQMEYDIYSEIMGEKHKNSFECDELIKREMVIWGAGVQGRSALELLSKNGLNITGFIDNNENKWGSICDGLKVCSPEELKSETVIIPNNYYIEVKKQILGMSKNNSIIDLNRIKAYLNIL